MSYAILFDVPLTCRACGNHVTGKEANLYTSHLNPMPRDTSVHLGDVLALHPDDISDAYRTLRAPGDERIVRILEIFRCPVCNAPQWALIELERLAPEQYRLRHVETVDLAPDLLDSVHYVSARTDVWLEGNPGPEAEWIAERLAKATGEG